MEDLFQSLSEAGVHLPELDKYRQRMAQRLDRAFDFVDELLRTARLRAEGGEPFDISDCLEEARSGLNGAADCVVIDCPSGLPPRTGVRRRFVLAMINLLRNATQAAAASQAPQVRVSVHRQDQRIQILIDDNGPGVDQTDRQHIFLEGACTAPHREGVIRAVCPGVA